MSTNPVIFFITEKLYIISLILFKKCGDLLRGSGTDTLNFCCCRWLCYKVPQCSTMHLLQTRRILFALLFLVQLMWTCLTFWQVHYLFSEQYHHPHFIHPPPTMQITLFPMQVHIPNLIYTQLNHHLIVQCLHSIRWGRCLLYHILHK